MTFARPIRRFRASPALVAPIPWIRETQLHRKEVGAQGSQMLKTG